MGRRWMQRRHPARNLHRPFHGPRPGKRDDHVTGAADHVEPAELGPAWIAQRTCIDHELTGRGRTSPPAAVALHERAVVV